MPEGFKESFIPKTDIRASAAKKATERIIHKAKLTFQHFLPPHFTSHTKLEQLAQIEVQHNSQSVPEEAYRKRPEFNGGSVIISHFSDSPEGFEFATGDSIRKNTGGISANLSLTDEQKGRLQKSIQREMQFQGVENLNQAKQAWREAQKALQEAQVNQEEANLVERLTEQATQLQQIFEHERQIYIKGMAGKVGIRNVTQEGNTLVADVKLVAFPIYSEFSKPSDTPEILDLSAVVGTAMILRSADGRIIIQHRAVEKQRLHEEKRTRGNASYTDIPGASVAGLVDASLKTGERKPGTPDPLDTEGVKTAIFKEAGEELGLDEEDLQKVRLVGVAHDKIKIHDEILLLANSRLTADQIREKSRTSPRNKNLADADFEEKFVDIEGTPQAIEKLLTQVRCPLPPTHAAALVAAGYSLVLQEQGVDAAKAWKAKLEQEVKQNYQAMDNIVRIFYKTHPEALTQVPERFWGKNIPQRNLEGYTPAYTPEEQGLPNFDDEMVRVGLIPEMRREIDEAYLFDVDGVLTDPITKEAPDPQLLLSIIDKLKQGKPVALNTGRSTTWLQEKVINPLIQMTDDKSIIENLVAIGEKGGTWITFDAEGNAYHGKSNAAPLPPELHEKVRQLVTEKYADVMFFDETKQTMITVEMQEGFDLDEFTRRQREFRDDITSLLSEIKGGDQFRIDPTTIATDIENTYVGKDVGSDRFLQFLKDRDIKPHRFRIYGDSRSDFGIPDELFRRNQVVKFVYVGDRVKLEKAGIIQKDYPVEYLGGFTQGTLNSLQTK